MICTTKIVILHLFILCSCCCSDETFVLHNNIHDTIKLSKEFNRPALIIFSADWCKHCVSLKKDFSNKQIIEMDDYIICIIDADFDGKDANRFDVKTLPTSIILIGDKEKSRKVGYIHKEFRTWLQKQKQFD